MNLGFTPGSGYLLSLNWHFSLEKGAGSPLPQHLLLPYGTWKGAQMNL